MLQSQLTRFFGREAEMQQLLELIPEARLLSLVGAPGSGKTRLAMELTLRLEGHFRGGVSFVHLGPVTDPDHVAGTVATAVGVGEHPGRAIVDGLIDTLRATSAPSLLVLDNCEHVADAARDLADQVVTRCPTVVVVATSRTALGLADEQVRQMPRLELSAATDLFVDRASLASQAFRDRSPSRRTEADAAVADICLLLDRLPLAIELTAAWTRVLSLGQIVEHLTKALPLLIRDDPSTHDRQETMVATVDRSYHLLPPGARRLFVRVSVFAGGFDLTAACAVSPEAGDVPGDLATLVDHSLVVVAGDGRSRYRVLEPVRQCADALLAATGEREATRRLQAEHYLRLLGRFDPLGLRGVTAPVDIKVIAAEDANLVGTLAWARAQAPGLALRLCEAMAPYWLADGRVNDGRAWLEEVLRAGAPDPTLQAYALEAASSLAWRAGDYDLAGRRIEEALAVASQLDDPKPAIVALISKARLTGTDGDVATTVEACDAAIAACDAIGETAARFWALVFRAWAHYIVGDVAGGDAQMHAAAETTHGVDESLAITTVLFGLQFGAFLAGDPVAHRTHLVGALQSMQQGRLGIQEEADWLGSAAALAATEGRLHPAIRLMGAALLRMTRARGATTRRASVPRCRPGWVRRGGRWGAPGRSGSCGRARRCRGRSWCGRRPPAPGPSGRC